MQPQGQAHHHRQSYYAVLGVQPGATAAEIRAAYHRLAMRWHPDKIASGGGGADPASAEEAKSRFQQIHEAYQVLSDDKRRALYDAGMYDDDDQEDVEGFHDFVQEMVSLMAREEPVYSLAELQSMLDGMIKDFTAPQPWPSGFFYTGGGGGGGGGASSPSPLGKPSSQEQSTASSRLHPYGFGDAPCFSRTAFSQ